MNPERIAALVLRQYYLMRGNVVRVVPLFIWVAIDIILWGFITRYLNSVSAPGLNFVPQLLGAVLLWNFLTRVMHGVIMALLEDVWSRNFLNFFATPLTTAEYIAGLVITAILTSFVGLVVMLGLASGIFGLSFLAYGWLLVPFMLVLFLFGIALGILACAGVLRLGPSAEWLVWPIPALVSPFVGVFYPLATLPHWMQMVAKALPPSYVFDAMRAWIKGREVPLGALGMGAGLAVLYIVLACAFFSSVYRRALRTGLIARYSAESVS